MMENALSQGSMELLVQLTGAGGMPRTKRVLFTPEGSNKVPAGELKQGFLNLFGEGSPLMEAEALSDENRSFHLMAFDDSGQGTTFSDGEEIDMKRYKNFEVTPRTTGGLIHLS